MRWGIQPITYGLTWEESLAAARAVDDLGFDYLWGHDHLWSTGGDRLQPFFEGWSTVTAWAALTKRVRIGLLVGANPFRHPSLVAKIAATVDHISGGRLILGLGAGNREDETVAHGMDPGASVGERLDRLDESLDDHPRHPRGRDRHALLARTTRSPARGRPPGPSRRASRSRSARAVSARASASSRATPTSGSNGSDRTRSTSSGTRARCSMRTSRTSGAAPSEVERHLGGRLILRADDATARRDFEAQVRLHGWGPEMTSFAWVGTAERIAESVARYRDAGVDGVSLSVAAPLDIESLERLARDVRPLVDRA